MREQHRTSGIPLGTGPGIFGSHNNKVRIRTLAGAIEFVYPNEETAARVVRRLRKRLGGGTPAAVALRGEFSWPRIRDFLVEGFGADVPQPSRATRWLTADSSHRTNSPG